MQLILVGAAIVSLAIKEWSTGVLLIVITMVNAIVACAAVLLLGLWEAGKLIARRREAAVS